MSLYPENFCLSEEISIKVAYNSKSEKVFMNCLSEHESGFRIDRKIR